MTALQNGSKHIVRVPEIVINIPQASTPPPPPIADSQQIQVVSQPKIKDANQPKSTWKQTGLAVASGLFNGTVTVAKVGCKVAKVCGEIGLLCLADYGMMAVSSKPGATFLANKFLAVDPKAMEENENIVNSLQDGGIALARFLKTIAPKLVKLMAPLHPLADSLYQTKFVLFSQVLEAALLKGVVNLMKGTKKANPSVFDIVAILFENIDPSLKDLVLKAEASGNLKEKERLLREAFIPILDKAFPKGAKELGIQDEAFPYNGQISKVVWGQIQSNALFEIIFKFFIESPVKASKQRLELEKTPSGQVLLFKAKHLAQKLTYEVLKKGLSEARKSEQETAKMAEKIAKLARNALPDCEGLPKETNQTHFKDEFEKSLCATLLTAGQNKDHPTVTKMWKYVASRIEALIITAEYNLATKKGTRPVGDDPLSSVLISFKDMLADFYLQDEFHGKYKIESSMAQKLKEEYFEIDKLSPDDPKRKLWLEKNFKPLSQILLRSTGLDKESVICFNQMLNADNPNWVFDLFGVIVSTNPSLTSWMAPENENKKKQAEVASLPGGEVYIAASQKLSRIIISSLSEQTDSETIKQLPHELTVTWLKFITSHQNKNLSKETFNSLQLIAPRWFSALNAEIKTKLKDWIFNEIQSWISNPQDISNSTFAEKIVNTLSIRYPNFSTEAGEDKNKWKIWLETQCAENTINSQIRDEIKSWISETLTTTMTNHSLVLAKRSMQVLEKNSPAWFATLSKSDKEKLHELLENAIRQQVNFPDKNFGIVLTSTIEHTFRSYLPEEDRAKEKFQSWICKQISKIPPHAEALWQFIQKHLEGTTLTFLTKILDADGTEQQAQDVGDFFHLIDGTERQEMETPMSIVKDYFTKNPVSKIIQTEYANIAQLHEKDPARISWIKEYFAPLSMELLVMGGLRQERKLKTLGMDELINSYFSTWLFDIYGLMSKPKEGFASTEHRLGELLFDKELFRRDAKQRAAFGDLMIDSPRLSRENAQLQAAGIDVQIKQIKNFISGVAGPYIKQSILKHLKSPEAMDWLLGHLKPEEDVPDETIIKFYNHATSLLDEGNPATKAGVEYIQHLLEMTLPKILLNITESIEANRVPAKDGHRLKHVPEHFVEHVLTIIKDFIQANDLTLQSLLLKLREAKLAYARAKRDILTANSSEKANIAKKELQHLNEEISAIILPSLAKQFLAMTGGADVNDPKHPLSDIPLPKEFKKKLWDKIIPETITSLIVTWNCDMQQDHASLRTELRNKIYNQKDAPYAGTRPDNSKYLQEFKNVCAQFIRAKIPEWISANDNIVFDAVDLFKKHLEKNGDAGAQDLLKYLNMNPKLFVSIAADLQSIARNHQNESTQVVLGILEAYIEPLLESTLAGLSKNIAKVHTDKAFLLQLTTEVMEITNDHMRKVNLVTKMQNKSQPYEVDPKLMFTQYRLMKTVPQDAHHPLPPDPKLSKYKKLHKAFRRPDLSPEEAMMEEFFKPLTKKLLRLCNIKADTLPVPESMRTDMFEALQNKFGPKMIGALINQLLSESSLRKMQISFNNKLLNGPLEPGTGLTEDEMKEFKTMINKCGSIIHPFINLLNDWVANAIFKNFTSIRQMADDALGGVIVSKVKNLSALDDVLAKIFKTSASTMHEGQWGEATRDRFIPGRIVNGVFLPNASGRCNFPALVTPEQRKAAEQVAKETDAKLKEEATQGTIQVGNHGIDVTIADARKRIWEKVANFIDCLCKKIFGEKYAPVAEVLKAIITYIVKFFDLVFYPIYWLIVRPIKNLHVSIQMRKLEKNIACPINMNLMLQSIELLVDRHIQALEEQEKKKTSETLVKETTEEVHPKESVLADHPIDQTESIGVSSNPASKSSKRKRAKQQVQTSEQAIKPFMNKEEIEKEREHVRLEVAKQDLFYHERNPALEF
jgi:hypothetical protein